MTRLRDLRASSRGTDLDTTRGELLPQRQSHRLHRVLGHAVRAKIRHREETCDGRQKDNLARPLCDHRGGVWLHKIELRKDVDLELAAQPLSRKLGERPSLADGGVAHDDVHRLAKPVEHGLAVARQRDVELCRLELHRTPARLCHQRRNLRMDVAGGDDAVPGGGEAESRPGAEASPGAGDEDRLLGRRRKSSGGARAGGLCDPHA